MSIVKNILSLVKALTRTQKNTAPSMAEAEKRNRNDSELTSYYVNWR